MNIAPRMESSGEHGKVNISGSTYELEKDKFKCTYRGKIEAKNKGITDMYFVKYTGAPDAVAMNYFFSGKRNCVKNYLLSFVLSMFSLIT